MRMAPVAAGTDAGASGLFLERAVELSALGERLEAVGRSSRGQLVLVGGEAGVGKTTLLRRFCDAHSRSARVLWGGCDALFTPRPLGPLLAVAEDSGGELEALVESGAMPHEVVAALARRAERAGPHRLRSRGRALGGRGDARRPHAARAADRDACRLWSSPATATTSSTAGHPLRLVLGELATSQRGRADEARRAVVGGGRAARRAVRRRRGRALRQDRRQPVLRRRGARQSRPRRSRTRSGTPCSPAPRASAPPAGRCWRRSRSCRRRPSSGSWTRSSARPSSISTSA